jgi:hypothetical protein
VTDETAHSGRYCLKWDFARAEGKGSVYGRDHWLIVNVQILNEVAKQLRGKRVRVGYWFRLGGGAAVPGLTLRQFGKAEFLGGLSYSGGIEDPASWNHFVTEGRLREDFEGLDIHISCPIPSDPEQARKALFYIDDVSLQAVEEPPLAITTPLDEYYVGESIRLTVSAAQSGGQVKLALLAGTRPVAELARQRQGDPMQGAFATRGLVPGIYTILGTLKDAQGIVHTARRQIILSSDPFSWNGKVR